MKKDMMETRTALENTVKLHKESVHKQRSIEAEITVSCYTKAPMKLYWHNNHSHSLARKY